jgi:hypothetical protein
MRKKEEGRRYYLLPQESPKWVQDLYIIQKEYEFESPEIMCSKVSNSIKNAHLYNGYTNSRKSQQIDSRDPS